MMMWWGKCDVFSRGRRNSRDTRCTSRSQSDYSYAPLVKKWRSGVAIYTRPHLFFSFLKGSIRVEKRSLISLPTAETEKNLYSKKRDCGLADNFIPTGWLISSCLVGKIFRTSRACFSSPALPKKIQKEKQEREGDLFLKVGEARPRVGANYVAIWRMTFYIFLNSRPLEITLKKEKPVWRNRMPQIWLYMERGLF